LIGSEELQIYKISGFYIYFVDVCSTSWRVRIEALEEGSSSPAQEEKEGRYPEAPATSLKHISTRRYAPVKNEHL
jgi:hypothetical protein